VGRLHPHGAVKPIATLAIMLAAVCCACSPAKPVASASPPPSPKPAAPPARMETMICRDSQTGKSVACGEANAVMVGMKEN